MKRKEHLSACITSTNMRSYQSHSVMNDDGTISLGNGVYRSRLTTSGRSTKRFYTKDRKYWAKTKQEVDLYNKYKEIYTIVYIAGLISPTDKIHTPMTAIDGYQLHIIGELK
jgi:hypothetical protein